LFFPKNFAKISFSLSLFLSFFFTSPTSLKIPTMAKVAAVAKPAKSGIALGKNHGHKVTPRVAREKPSQKKGVSTLKLKVFPQRIGVSSPSPTIACDIIMLLFTFKVHVSREIIISFSLLSKRPRPSVSSSSATSSVRSPASPPTRSACSSCSGSARTSVPASSPRGG